MAKKKSGSDLQSVSLVLQSLLANGKSPLSDHFLRWKLWRLWPEVVGPEMAKYAEPVGFRNGELYLWVESSARMQDMRFIIGEIKDKLNQWGGREWIHFIRLTLDRKSVPGREEMDPQSSDFLKE